MSNWLVLAGLQFKAKMARDALPQQTGRQPQQTGFQMNRKTLPAFLIGLLFATTALAQSESASIQFNFLNIEGFSGGTRFVLDDAYEQNAGRPIPARLELIVPMANDYYRVLLDNQPSGGMVKIAFATKDRVLIDSVHIIGATIPMGPIKDRLTQFAGLMRDTAFPASVQGMGNPKLLGLRDYQMGAYPAVELVGTYVDPNLGPMYLRILGVPHPQKAESIFIIMNINASLEPLENISDLPKTLSGRTVSSVKFTD